jgi:hypothetical protein
MLRRFMLASVVVVLLLLMLAPTVLASGYVYEKSFGRYGTSLGELRFPMGISADGKGALYIADLNNSKIQKFTTDGVFIGSVGSYGSALGELNYPYQTLVDSTGSLLVGENGASRVQASPRSARGAPSAPAPHSSPISTP